MKAAVGPFYAHPEEHWREGALRGFAAENGAFLVLGEVGIVGAMFAE